MLLLEKPDCVPFSVDPKMISDLKYQMDLYKKEYVPKIDNLFSKMPEISEYDDILK